MSSPTGVPDDDYWRQPDERSEPASPIPAADPVPPYSGPPRTDPPPPTWHPPVVSEPPPPRSMPPQDLTALDESERSARTVTYGVGLVIGAIALVLMCLLCGRLVF